MEANFARATDQLRVKPPVFCKHAREQLVKLKNEDAIKKSESTRHVSLISSVHQHCAWPDPIS
jgi:hypothetical protein